MKSSWASRISCAFNNNCIYLKLNWFAEHHLVERPDEEAVEEFAVEDGHPGHPTDELEVGEVVLVAHPGVGVDLGKDDGL